MKETARKEKNRYFNIPFSGIEFISHVAFRIGQFGFMNHDARVPVALWHSD
jgi:hypothetical protein